METKPANFKRKSKHHLHAVICCLLAMQIASTTDNHLIMVAVFNSRPKTVFNSRPLKLPTMV